MERKILLQQDKNMMNVIRMSTDLFLGAMEAYDILGLHELLVTEKVILINWKLQYEMSTKNLISRLVNLLNRDPNFLSVSQQCLLHSLSQKRPLVTIFLLEIFYQGSHYNEISNIFTIIFSKLSSNQLLDIRYDLYLLCYHLEPKYLLLPFESIIRRATQESSLEIIVTNIKNYLLSYSEICP